MSRIFEFNLFDLVTYVKCTLPLILVSVFLTWSFPSQFSRYFFLLFSVMPEVYLFVKYAVVINEQHCQKNEGSFV